MMRLSIAAVLILVSSVAMGERKPVDEITSFVCELPAGQTRKVKCSGAGGVLNESYKLLQIYQFAAHPTRLWFAADDRRYIVGVDQTCGFEGTPLFAPIPGTPTPPNQPPRPCPPYCGNK